MKLNLQAAIDGELDEQLNLALCEWLGMFDIKPLRRTTRKGKEAPDGVVLWYCSRHSGGWAEWEKLPNHIAAPESLGLVHEVEKLLLQDLHARWMIELCKITNDSFWSTTRATARQRVIAILQTVKPEIFE